MKYYHIIVLALSYIVILNYVLYKMLGLGVHVIISTLVAYSLGNIIARFLFLEKDEKND